VTVNGEPITNDFVSSAFVIELDKLGLKIGDSVNIKIYHDKGCEPQIVNDLALISPAKLKYENLKLDSLGVLSWCASNENSPKTFYIEQYKWNKWVVVGQIQGIGGADKNCYKFQVDLHSGENTFKIVQETPGKNKASGTSSEVKVISNVKISLLLSKGNDIAFSLPTHYEIYNTFGEIVMKGFSAKPNLKPLPIGLYYINYDNTTGDVFNKNKK
jgi:hypothetical protein